MKYRYFIYYKFQRNNDSEGFGNTITVINEKLLRKQDIRMIEDKLKEGNNWNTVIVCNFQLLQEVPDKTPKNNSLKSIRNNA